MHSSRLVSRLGSTRRVALPSTSRPTLTRGRRVVDLECADAHVGQWQPVKRQPYSTTSQKPTNSSDPHPDAGSSSSQHTHDQATRSTPHFQQRDAKDGDRQGMFSFPTSPLFDSALTTLVGIGILFLGGVAYVEWYKKRVLDKIELAFAKGYDPALELADLPHRVKNEHWDKDIPLRAWTSHLRREDQDVIDAIVKGEAVGNYYCLMGPKGAGKSTLIFDAMRTIQAEGVAVLEAHPDLEVFRLRLGKALNFEFNEDTQTGLFQRRDPREAGPELDIERALNKLEKVALRAARKRGKPYVLIFNNVHHFKNDDAGRNMILQLQQRAETWSASGIVTVVFATDDFWPFLELRRAGSRMRILSIRDLDRAQACHALALFRHDRHGQSATQEAIEQYHNAVSLIGGRLSVLTRIALDKDVDASARKLVQAEKAWLQSLIGLIPDLDDDVMDEQKWSSCSWLLLKEFVEQHREQERLHEGSRDPIDLPKIPYWRCRQIMTRPDFLEDLDRANIISIDVNLDVRPDSMLILHAAREVVEEEKFDDMLDNVRARVDEIEGLHRTRELTFKNLNEDDVLHLVVDKKERKKS